MYYFLLFQTSDWLTDAVRPVLVAQAIIARLPREESTGAGRREGEGL